MPRQQQARDRLLGRERGDHERPRDEDESEAGRRVARAAGEDGGGGEDLGVGHDRDDAVPMQKLAELDDAAPGRPGQPLRRGAHRGRGRGARQGGGRDRRAGARAGGWQQRGSRGRRLPRHGRARADARRRARRHVVHRAGGRAVGPVRRGARRAEGLAGIECLSGIPGSIGATPIQNVGAYGQEVAEVITSVRVFDRAEHEVAELTPDQCGFSYRSSAFKREPGQWVVLAVSFELDPQPRLAADPLHRARAHAGHRAGRERTARRRARGRAGACGARRGW